MSDKTYKPLVTASAVSDRIGNYHLRFEDKKTGQEKFVSIDFVLENGVPINDYGDDMTLWDERLYVSE
jgi:hypothetical protein